MKTLNDDFRKDKFYGILNEVYKLQNLASIFQNQQPLTHMDICDFERSKDEIIDKINEIYRELESEFKNITNINKEKFTYDNMKNHTVCLGTKQEPCVICGEPTNYIDYCCEARTCSIECYDELNQMISTSIGG